MLRELHISNLAVIQNATIDLRQGLNAFTGQTGAGKSLVIGAFEVLLGLRSATDLLRNGADQGRVSGIFELTDPALINRINQLADLDMTPEQNTPEQNTPAQNTPDKNHSPNSGGPQQLLITRKLFASGRTSVSINGHPATAAMLRSVGQLLVDVHGQHDHQFLLKPAHQLSTLDHFAKTQTLRNQYSDLYQQISELRNRRSNLQTSAALRVQQLDLYEFQASEIDPVDPTEGEFEEIASRHRLLSNMEKVKADASAIYAALYESEGSILERIQALDSILDRLVDFDEQLKPVSQSIHSAMSQLQDAAFELNRHMHRMDLNPAELDEVTDRLNALNRLIHKYGSTQTETTLGQGQLQDVINYRQFIADQINALTSQSEDLSSIDAAIAPLLEKLQTVGATLSKKRQTAAKKLKPLIESQLKELGMADATFDITFAPISADSEQAPSGLDAIEMLVRANPGQPARPLRKVASGGEMSRIMLAIKSIAANNNRLSVLVFDEIDANIGGRMGSIIGQKLQALAAQHQVLCITHLPQIAAHADHHLCIRKSIAKGQTSTTVTALQSNAERIDELAEMLTGKSPTQTTRAHAREMLQAASVIPNKTATTKSTKKRPHKKSPRARAAA